MSRGDLDALIEERIHYTVKYAGEHSPFYKKWFREHGINPSDIRTHEDLRELPVISGRTIRENQPPEDLVHLDIYDPRLQNFLPDGECGRTHMKIMTPQRESETLMRVSVECLDREKCDRRAVEENFLRAFFRYKPGLEQAYADGIFKIIFNFAGLRDLELFRIKGRPKRLVDRR